MSGIEGLEAAAWIHATLTNDAQLSQLVTGVYDTLAPQSAAAPFVVFSEATPVADTNGLGGRRVLVRGTWQIRVTVEGMSWASAAEAVARIDQLLQGHVGGSILGCVRTGTVKIAETTAQDREFRHLGGLYEITIG